MNTKKTTGPVPYSQYVAEMRQLTNAATFHIGITGAASSLAMLFVWNTPGGRIIGFTMAAIVAVMTLVGICLIRWAGRRKL